MSRERAPRTRHLRQRSGSFRLRLGVDDQHGLHGVLQIGIAHRHRRPQLGGRLAGKRVDVHRAPVRGQRREDQEVVRQDGLHHRRDLVEDLADVEHVRHHRQQSVDGVQAAAARGLQAPQALVLERQPQEIGDRLQGRLVPGREGARTPGFDHA